MTTNLHRLTCCALLVCGTASAKVDAERAAALGKSLTPVGAQRAGNAQGTIPAWDGGLKQSHMARGDNPYADEKPLYTITASNLDQYSDLLSEGHKALFRTFPKTYKMKVYPSHRSASYPDWLYQATIGNATKVELTDNGYGFCCTARGFPFPIPENGTEVMWNHIMRYNTRGYRGYLNNAIVQPNGGHVVERDYLELTYVYNNPDTKLEELDNRNLYAMTKTVAPATKAGEAALLHVPIDRIKDQTGLWIYNNGVGRVRRVGEVGYDNPLFEGLITHDQIDMFNGPLDRYTIKLIGKREMLVPYNSYALYSNDIDYDDLIQPGHLNQDIARYELHRVWVIEAQVRDGVRHRYKTRTFYLDEDSWLVLMEDIYDERDQFWRTSEAHAVTFANVPVVINGLQIHYDLQSRRYVIMNMTNEERDMIEYDWNQRPGYFTPRSLTRFAKP